jgi:hypothetical protein
MLGCNQLFDISFVESDECEGPECPVRSWPTGPIPEIPECTPVEGSGGQLVQQPAASLIWSTSAVVAADSIAAAEAKCAALDVAGFREFHVATRSELLALLNLGSPRGFESSCTLDHAWVGHIESLICTASLDSERMQFCIDGRLSDVAKHNPAKGAIPQTYFCVQPLRREKRARFSKLPGVVFDRVTNLVWQADIPATSPQTNRTPRSWAAADAYCRALGAGWSLPTVKQLQTIIDETSKPMIDTEAFGSIDPLETWASTPAIGVAAHWRVFFTDGHTDTGFKEGTEIVARVRCVRPGPP